MASGCSVGGVVVNGRSSVELPSVARLVGSCAVLAVPVVSVAIGAATVANHGFSSDAALAAAIGGGICWLAASLGLVAVYVGNRIELPVQGVLVGMLFRMGLPLAALVLLPQPGGVFGVPGLAVTILCSYLVALVAETLLAVRMIPQRHRSLATNEPTSLNKR
jgi:hypothetical protein